MECIVDGGERHAGNGASAGQVGCDARRGCHGERSEAMQSHRTRRAQRRGCVASGGTERRWEMSRRDVQQTEFFCRAEVKSDGLDHERRETDDMVNRLASEGPSSPVSYVYKDKGLQEMRDEHSDLHLRPTLLR